MKSVILCLFLSIASFMGGLPVSAQIYSINQFKTTVYEQTNSSPPVAPNYPDAYFSGTYVITDPAYSVTNMVAGTPNGDQWIFNESDPSYFYFSGDYYANKTNFDQDFPGGTFDYNFDYTDEESNLDNVDLIFDCSTNDLNCTNIPAFNPECWTAMQAVDPAQDFVLNWNDYSLTDGADYDFTFLGVSDAISGDSVFSTSFPSNIITATIPAGTLQYGRLYNVSLYFSERQTPLPHGFPADSIVVGWDNLTQTTLSTAGLWLQIAPAGTNVLLTWPADATTYQLKTSTNLSNPSTWNVVTNLPTISGTTNFLTLPALNASAFFRLALDGN